MNRKLLMVLGPTEVEQDILDAGAIPQEYMRTPDYSEKWGEIFKNLQYVFQTQNPVVCFACSGTGAMDAAVSNLLPHNSGTALYINGGSFGKRWGDILNQYKIKNIEISVEFGKSVEPERIKQELEKNKDINTVFATLDETSSGALTDIKAIGEVLKNYPDIVFVVDCVSGLVVEELQMDEWGVDVAVSASQKALAIPPGLGFMAISDKALKRAEQNESRPAYFDILDYVKNWQRNQTPFTPAVSLVEQLKLRLEKIKSEGLENYRKRYRNNTELIRTGLKNLGFEVFAQHPANCVTGVMTEKYNAAEIVRIMREKHNIEIAPSGGDLKEKFFRVGNFGAIEKPEIERFLTAMQATIGELQ
ncbi:MAG: alanine--glyoxylate aminotransferase family protein [Fusobacterium sp.]|nr:alanine--glyoxylate aminotransferase family protein [Fusobacterium sp.]